MSLREVYIFFTIFT